MLRNLKSPDEKMNPSSDKEKFMRSATTKRMSSVFFSNFIGKQKSARNIDRMNSLPQNKEIIVSSKIPTFASLVSPKGPAFSNSQVPTGKSQNFFKAVNLDERQYPKSQRPSETEIPSATLPKNEHEKSSTGRISKSGGFDEMCEQNIQLSNEITRLKKMLNNKDEILEETIRGRNEELSSTLTSYALTIQTELNKINSELRKAQNLNNKLLEKNSKMWQDNHKLLSRIEVLEYFNKEKHQEYEKLKSVLRIILGQIDQVEGVAIKSRNQKMMRVAVQIFSEMCKVAQEIRNSVDLFETTAPGAEPGDKSQYLQSSERKLELPEIEIALDRRIRKSGTISNYQRPSLGGMSNHLEVLRQSSVSVSESSKRKLTQGEISEKPDLGENESHVSVPSKEEIKVEDENSLCSSVLSKNSIEDSKMGLMDLSNLAENEFFVQYLGDNKHNVRIRKSAIGDMEIGAKRRKMSIFAQDSLIPQKKEEKKNENFKEKAKLYWKNFRLFFFGHLGFQKSKAQLTESDRLYLKWKTVFRRIVNRNIEKQKVKTEDIGGSCDACTPEEIQINMLKKFLFVRSARRKEGLFKNKVKESLFKAIEVKYKNYLKEKEISQENSAGKLVGEAKKKKKSVQKPSKASVPISFSNPMKRNKFKKKQQSFLLSQMSHEELSSIKPYILLPSSHFRIIWDMSIVILVLYNVLLLPLQIGLKFDSHWTLDAVDNTADVLFGIDIILNFFTGSITEDNKLIMNSKAIRNLYFRSWFLLDVLATFPFELPLLMIGGEGIGINVNVLAILKTPRLLRLGRILKFMENLKSANIWRIVRLFFLFFLAAQWVGCFWYWIASTPQTELEVPPPLLWF